MRIESFGGVVRRCSVARAACLLALGALFWLLAGPGGLLGGARAAAAPAELWTECRSGAGAGQCSIPRGIAADPENGHVFIADSINNRIVELNALGQFVKAWGWGVDTGAEAPQTCTAASECQAGLAGSGTGQFGFGSPQGLAVDSAGFIYAVDRGLPSNQRVQKFDPAGNFVLMFGGDVNKTKVEAGGASEAEENLCTAASGDECQRGTAGTGEGQFANWPATGAFIAVDRKGTATDGDDLVYVGDSERIQVFDSGGAYLSELALPGRTVRSLAVDASGELYAIYNGQPDVRKITAAGEELAAPRFELTDPNGDVVRPTAVAVSAAGNVFAFGPTSYQAGLPMDPIFEFDPAGNEVDNFGIRDFSGSTGLATNLCPESEAPGNLYVSNATGGEGPPQSDEAFVRAYGTEPVGCFRARTLPASEIEETAAVLNGAVNPKGEPVSECFFEFGESEEYGQTAPCAEPAASEIGEGSEPVAVRAQVGGLEPGTVHHFRLIAKVGGETETGADVTFKTLGPPLIVDDWTVAATASEVAVKALVSPEGFATTYRFEYGTSEEYGQSTPELALGSDRSEHAVTATLGGLEPGTDYHWRLVATNSSGRTEGEDNLATTYRVFELETGCPNQSLRDAASAFLPDCRAYEMVSPVDKNGGDIRKGIDGIRPGGYTQAAPDGGRITYTAFATFGDQPAGALFNQYLGARGEEGWSTQGIHPPISGRGIPGNSNALGRGREFSAFSPDLCSAWLVDRQEPPPTADGQPGHENLYRRRGCGGEAGGLEALVPAPPLLAGGTPIAYVGVNSVQGVSEDGRHAIFVAAASLPHAPEAAAGGSAQIYDRFCPLAPVERCGAGTPGARLALVSVLPDGTANPAGAVVGSGFLGNLEGAVSADGSHVYWTAGPAGVSGLGKIHLRTHPEQGIVGEECTPGRACTVAVSGGFPAFFWSASPEGSRALYSEENLFAETTELHLFEPGAPGEAGTRRQIAADVEGVAGHAEDLSRVYFVSRRALAGGASAGEPNLYLDSEGEISLVATLAEGDVGAREPGEELVAYDVASNDSLERASRVSADGRRIAFQSRAPLTGYENTELRSGKPAVEVFSYEAGGELVCVSCNPSRARPLGREMPKPYGQVLETPRTGVFAAAWLPTWEQPLHASAALSADGKRLFFNSHDALVPRDANGTQDVYEWEEAGTGSCSEASPSYFPQNGGCLYLISSGESDFESEFWEASPDGEDVFFTTASSLLPQDPGLIDLYDARVGGGFPQPAPRAACEGEACQSPPPPPELAPPASGAFRGPGNVAQRRNCGALGRRAAGLSRRARKVRRATRRVRSAAKTKRLRRRARGLGNRARRLSRNAKRCRRANNLRARR